MPVRNRYIWPPTFLGIPMTSRLMPSLGICNDGT